MAKKPSSDLLTFSGGGFDGGGTFSEISGDWVGVADDSGMVSVDIADTTTAVPTMPIAAAMATIGRHRKVREVTPKN